MKDKKKVMISQQMNGLTDEEIEKTKLKATKELVAKGYEVVNTFFNDGIECEVANKQKNVSVAYLALSIAKMAEVDTVYFCKGWSKTRGCQIEHQIAEKYNYEILGFEE